MHYSITLLLFLLVSISASAGNFDETTTNCDIDSVADQTLTEALFDCNWGEANTEIDDNDARIDALLTTDTCTMPPCDLTSGTTLGGAAIQTGTDDDVPEAGDFGNATDLDANGALNANSVDSAEIAADAVGTSEIATNGVDSAEIAADAVGTSELLLSIAPAWTGDHDFGGGGIEIENNTAIPGSCTVGQIFLDTDGTSGQQLYACESGSFVKQGQLSGGDCSFSTDGTNTITCAAVATGPQSVVLCEDTDDGASCGTITTLASGTGLAANRTWRFPDKDLIAVGTATGAHPIPLPFYTSDSDAYTDHSQWYYLDEAATIVDARCTSDGGTATVNFEERSTVNVSGTDVWSAAVNPDADGATGTISNAGLAADSYLTFKLPAAGTDEIINCIVNITYD